LHTQKKGVVLYVKSKMTTKVEDVGKYGVESPFAWPWRAAPPKVWKTYDMRPEVTHVFELPEIQERIANMVQHVATKMGFEVEIIDVSRKDEIPKELADKARRITAFPTLTTASGRTLQGDFTKKELKAFLSTEPESS
jgi:hypothetical protein